MAISYLHGLETIELQGPAGPVETVKSNVIHVTGTAPNADPAKFPLNTPVALFADAAKAAELKTAGTLLDSLDAIYNQGSAMVVVTRVAEGSTQAETWANAVGSVTAKTGVWSALNARSLLRVVPKIHIAPGLTGDRPTNGVRLINLTSQGSGYADATTTVTIGDPGGGGRKATAVAQISVGRITGITITDPGYGYTGTPTVTITGAGSGAVASATLGNVANPVGQAMSGLVKRLRAVAFVDGPGTTYEAAVNYRGDYGSDRVMVIDPGVLKFDTGLAQYVTRPASSYAAGIQSRIDKENGFWFPFSNNEITGIGGPSRPVDFMPNDRDSEANMLNASQVTTIIHDDGFRFWGLRGTGNDSLWAHMAVRRTADMVYESLEREHRKYMDKPFSYQLLSGIQLSVNRYLALLQSRGALIGGRCWIDPSVNTPQTFAAGQLTVDFDLEPPAGLESLQFRARRNPDYYSDFIEDFSRRVAGA